MPVKLATPINIIYYVYLLKPIWKITTIFNIVSISEIILTYDLRPNCFSSRLIFLAELAAAAVFEYLSLVVGSPLFMSS